jgi:hypothetical protein
MEGTMYKLLRIALFAAPLVGGVAWAQASGTSGSAGAPGSVTPPPVTDDTRTPLQQKAGRLDDTTPVLPGDATKPVDIPNTVKESDRTGMPDANGMTTPGSQGTDKKVHKRKGAAAPAPKSEAPKSDESTLDRKSDVDHDATRMQNKLDSDLNKDQLDSDK